jgi:hypothetical protein
MEESSKDISRGKTVEGYWVKENNVPVSLCHHKSHTDYGEA